MRLAKSSNNRTCWRKFLLTWLSEVLIPSTGRWVRSASQSIPRLPTGSETPPARMEYRCCHHGPIKLCPSRGGVPYRELVRHNPPVPLALVPFVQASTHGYGCLIGCMHGDRSRGCVRDHHDGKIVRKQPPSSRGAPSWQNSTNQERSVDRWSKNYNPSPVCRCSRYLFEIQPRFNVQGRKYFLLQANSSALEI